MTIQLKTQKLLLTIKTILMKKITFLLLIMFTVAINAQTTTASYTFDTDVETWVPAGATLGYDATNYKANAGSIKMVGAANKLVASPKLDITPGTYTFTVFVKGTVDTSIRTQFKEWDSGDATNGDIFVIPASGGITGGDGGSWFKITQTKEISAAGQVSFRIQNKSADTATFYIDDITIIKASATGNELTINTVGAGSVAKTLDKISYEATDTETLTATAARHWAFDSWSGDLTGTTNPGSILMDADKTVTANFTIDPTFNYAFNFDTDGDLEGWTMDPKVVVKSHTGGLVTLSLEADQWSRLNLFDFPIPATKSDASKYNKVTVVVKNEEASTNQFAVTLGANNETEVFPLLNQAGFQTFEINLTKFTDWTGDVTSLRIRFADENNTAKTGRPSVSHDVVIDSVVFSFDAAFVLSTKDNLIENFSFYPNPAKNIINFASTKNNISKVQIFNVIGKKVLETKNIKNNSLNISTLNKGIYFLRVYDIENKKATQKLIIN